MLFADNLVKIVIDEMALETDSADIVTLVRDSTDCMGYLHMSESSFQ